MGRTIDADALRARMYHESFETDSDMQKWDSGCWIRYKLFEKCLEEQPTVQPQRMRGRWKRTYLDHEAMGERPSIFYCSACNQCIAFPTNYCPACGADMKEGQ